MNMITIVDSHLCNLMSVTTALNRVGAKWNIANTPDQISEASGIILPGVGAFADGMNSLRERELIDPIKAHAKKGKLILGICLGMQMLAESSEEFGVHGGLGLIQGKVCALPHSENFRVPNIGWCDVKFSGDSSLLNNIGNLGRQQTFYFAHSYFLQCSESVKVTGKLDLDSYSIPVVVEKGSIFGVQFHPEKSQDAGLMLFHQFATLVSHFDRVS